MKKLTYIMIMIIELLLKGQLLLLTESCQLMGFDGQYFAIGDINFTASSIRTISFDDGIKLLEGLLRKSINHTFYNEYTEEVISATGLKFVTTESYYFNTGTVFDNEDLQQIKDRLSIKPSYDDDNDFYDGDLILDLTDGIEDLQTIE